jgi:hypothetical protein
VVVVVDVDGGDVLVVSAIWPSHFGLESSERFAATGVCGEVRRWWLVSLRECLTWKVPGLMLIAGCCCLVSSVQQPIQRSTVS